MVEVEGVIIFARFSHIPTVSTFLISRVTLSPTFKLMSSVLPHTQL